jgi:hypothetical protein
MGDAMANKTRGIAKVVKIVNLYEADNDFEWWQSQPYQVRLAALEEMRREYHGWKEGEEPRIQKVVTILRRQGNVCVVVDRRGEM